MITVEAEIGNPISQDFYDKILFSLDLAVLRCTCGHVGDMIWHGRYERKVILPDQVLSLRISRVLCRHCGHTHAILPSSIVPYSRIPLAVHAAVAVCCGQGGGYRAVWGRHLFLTEESTLAIARSYRRHWQERLFSSSIRLAPLTELVRGCFASFSRQFMQIRNTPNQLFIPPT